jgi:hypothetical protein
MMITELTPIMIPSVVRRLRIRFRKMLRKDNFTSMDALIGHAPSSTVAILHPPGVDLESVDPAVPFHPETGPFSG